MNRTAPAIKRPTLTGSVADVIRRRIINSEFAGGDLIRQEALAAELGVSRIPVREALLQLEAEGLVIIRTHRGAVVAELSRDDAIDLFEARLMIEPVVLEQAVAKLSGGDVAEIEKALIAYEKAVTNGADPEDLSRLNWEFHTAMCLPSNRPRLLSILQSLYTATDRYLRMQIVAPQARERAFSDHRMLFEAIQARAPSLAVKLIKAHISEAYEDVMRGLAARADGKVAP